MPAPRERCHLAPVSAEGHAAPPSLFGARIIVEEELARRIRALAHGCCGALRQEFRRGTRNRCQQPFQALFARYESDAPFPAVPREFVMTLRYAQSRIDR